MSKGLGKGGAMYHKQAPEGLPESEWPTTDALTGLPITYHKPDAFAVGDEYNTTNDKKREGGSSAPQQSKGLGKGGMVYHKIAPEGVDVSELPLVDALTGLPIAYSTRETQAQTEEDVIPSGDIPVAKGLGMGGFKDHTKSK